MQKRSFTSIHFLDAQFKHLIRDILYRRKNALVVKVQNSTGPHNNCYCIIHNYQFSSSSGNFKLVSKRIKSALPNVEYIK